MLIDAGLLLRIGHIVVPGNVASDLFECWVSAAKRPKDWFRAGWVQPARHDRPQHDETQVGSSFKAHCNKREEIIR
jgi:hypothetical protein